MKTAFPKDFADISRAGGDVRGAPAGWPSLKQCTMSDAQRMSVRCQVAEQMWQLVIVRAQLPETLTAMKHYFLLARGDFYQSFLLEVTPAHAMQRLPMLLDFAAC